MTVRLRAHHLLCLLTYAGKGYTARFTANYDALVDRIERGEEIVIVSGPDDICAPLLGEPVVHCFGARVTRRDHLAAKAVSDLMPQPIFPGARLHIDRAALQAMRDAFASGRIRAACHGCEWHPLCSDIAAAGYRGCRYCPPS